MRQNGTVLIVDDEPEICETLEDLLSLQGYNLAFASNGSEALERAVELVPDLILLDVMLPIMDGFEVCRRLRVDPLLAEVPIIMITALADSGSRLRGIKAGADDFVSKPFDPVELQARVRTITQLNRYRRLLVERAKFERVIELSPTGIVIVDAEGTIRLASPAMLQLLGIKDEGSIIDKKVLAFVAPEEREHCATFFSGFIASASQAGRTETSFVRLDGERFTVEVDAGHFAWDGKPAVQIVVRDITERKRAEEQIQRQLEYLATLRYIDRAITAGLDLNSTLDVFIEQVTEQLHVDAVSVLLLNPHTQTLEYAAGQGFRRDDIARSCLRLGESYAGRAAFQRRIVRVPKLLEARENLMQARRVEGEGFVSYYAAPLITKGQVKGVLEILHRTPLDSEPEWLEFLEALAAQAAIAIDNAELFDDLQRANAELAQAYDATLEGWSRALEMRDKETKDHTRRVTGMTVRLARTMGFSEEELVHVRRGGLLHDIGKMAIPDGILLKPAPLTDAEEEIMHKHPLYAYEMLSPIPYLRPALDIPYCHHERWDGTGYPRGLKGEQIPLAARIFAVVDVWDALRSDRPYRSGWPEEMVRTYIRERAGKLFDPQVVEAFLKLERPPGPDGFGNHPPDSARPQRASRR